MVRSVKPKITKTAKFSYSKLTKIHQTPYRGVTVFGDLVWLSGCRNVLINIAGVIACIGFYL